MNHLYNYFKSNSKKVIHKWNHYFPIYERYFSKFRNTSVKFLEIGVSRGGSLQMWKDYFGPDSTIIGIDIEPACQLHSDPSDNIHVKIGGQQDTAFLQSVLQEFGSIDIVLDDGSHIMNHILTTFNYIHPQLHDTAVYMVEDLHTAYWPEYGSNTDDNFIKKAKEFIDNINAQHSRGTVPSHYMTNKTFGVSFHDSIVCIENCPKYESYATAIGQY